MASNDEFVVAGEIGTVLTVDMGRSVDGADPAVFEVWNPGTATTGDPDDTWTATADGNDLTYTTVADANFATAGTYTLQPYLTLGEWVGRGEPFTVRVIARGQCKE